MSKLSNWLLLTALWLAAAMAHAGTVTYVYTDPQGTPLAEADATGTITARFDYAPYGTAVASLGAAPNGPGYTGHVNDPDTGLVYMQARYYDAAVGRFLATDSAGVTSGNLFTFSRYAYANNNPIVNIDPDGQATEIAMKYHAVDIGLGYTVGHEFVTMRDTNSNVIYVSRAGPSADYPVLDGISNSQANYTNSKGDSTVMTLQAFTGLYSQSAGKSSDNHTVTGSVVVVPDDLSTVLKNASAISTAVNAANIPYLPKTTNSNSYANTTYQWLTGKTAPHQDYFTGPKTPLPVTRPKTPPPCKSVYPGEC
ncbi:MAG TPA: RHS repeat-associated core domain-containing protein [Rhodanobacter sp.]